MEPIRNSTLNKLRLEREGKGDIFRFLEPYLQFGTLVDHLITEPGMVNIADMSCRNISRYDDMTYYYEEDEFELALEMKRAYKENELTRLFFKHGQKELFAGTVQVPFEGELITVPVEGEFDMVAKGLDAADDVKVTAKESEAGFFKSVNELYYDQQGALYMDANELSTFVVSGISRKTKDSNGMPEVYNFVMKRDSDRYIQGRDRYRYWILEYLKEHELIGQLKKVA